MPFAGSAVFVTPSAAAVADLIVAEADLQMCVLSDPVAELAVPPMTAMPPTGRLAFARCHSTRSSLLDLDSLVLFEDCLTLAVVKGSLLGMETDLFPASCSAAVNDCQVSALPTLWTCLECN